MSVEQHEIITPGIIIDAVCSQLLIGYALYVAYIGAMTEVYTKSEEPWHTILPVIGFAVIAAGFNGAETYINLLNEIEKNLNNVDFLE